jgi:two-component system chemotaxis response regulator CheY
LFVDQPFSDLHDHDRPSFQPQLPCVNGGSIRRHCCLVTLDLLLEDGESLEVLQAMPAAKFAGSVIFISGTNAARRIEARGYARSLGIELQSLPKPLDFAALRICLANLCKTANGLPVMHLRGGVQVDGEAEQHRA